MSIRRILSSGLVFGFFLSVASPSAHGQEEKRRGRKYKVPPATSHIEVVVVKDANQKPVANAAVVFHAVKDGRDEGNLEVKTNDEGKAAIDVISTGSNVDIQVIADGFATFAGQYLVAEADRTIEIKMIRPRAQISTYVDTHGKAAERAVGVQEPAKPAAKPVAPKAAAPMAQGANDVKAPKI